ncbi:MAG: SEC-C domain-containing protein [Firmicutes bacterium]|nr:SEC-C domain-containing protein [Bacillota bacterium]
MEQTDQQPDAGDDRRFLAGIRRRRTEDLSGSAGELSGEAHRQDRRAGGEIRSETRHLHGLPGRYPDLSGKSVQTGRSERRERSRSGRRLGDAAVQHVQGRCDYLYGLEEWKNIVTEERYKQIYDDFRRSRTVRVEKKPGRNDPCPCGSGKKYKNCCGKNA